jgi:hypothetical protein
LLFCLGSLPSLLYSAVPSPSRRDCTVPPPCNGRLRTAWRMALARHRPETQKIASSCPQCRDPTSCKRVGMSLIPRTKILDHTIFHPQMFPQVKTRFRSLVPASTNMRSLRGCSNRCRVIHHWLKSLTRMRKVNKMFFPPFGKLNILVLMWRKQW